MSREICEGWLTYGFIDLEVDCQIRTGPPATQYKYFNVFAQKRKSTRKTLDYTLVSCGHDDILGTIEFYPNWRQHVFIPAHGSIWSSDCLADVRDFLAKMRG